MDFFSLARLKSQFQPAPARKRSFLPILQEDNFAASIIQLEMEIEIENFTTDDIQTLVRLYSRAIEYYVTEQSNYCIYFHNKIKQLLLKPSVMAVIGKEKGSIETPKAEDICINETEKTCELGKPSDVALKRRGIELTKDLMVNQQGNDLNNLLKNFKFAETVRNEMYNKALNDQMVALGKKVQRRKKSASLMTSLMGSLNTSKERIHNTKTSDMSNFDQILVNRKGDCVGDRKSNEEKSNTSIIRDILEHSDNSIEEIGQDLPSIHIVSM